MPGRGRGRCCTNQVRGTNKICLLFQMDRPRPLVMFIFVHFSNNSIENFETSAGFELGSLEHMFLFLNNTIKIQRNVYYFSQTDGQSVLNFDRLRFLSNQVQIICSCVFTSKFKKMFSGSQVARRKADCTRPTRSTRHHQRQRAQDDRRQGDGHQVRLQGRKASS